jgi:SAM-dependent methyltransferase
LHQWRGLRTVLLQAFPRRPKQWLFSGSDRFCPVCQSWLRRFLNYGARPDAICPICGSLERHRLTWLFLVEQTNLLDGTRKRLLHIAPERELGGRIKEIPGVDYVSADLSDPNAMMRFDVTDIPLPDQSFDVILCSHVLEHVPDDRGAMRELSRILRKTGWALLEIPPLRRPLTFEDSSITNPAERNRVFGQHDHVRIVGDDYPARIADNGWSVQRFTASVVAGERDMHELGLMAEEDIFFCRPMHGDDSIAAAARSGA